MGISYRAPFQSRVAGEDLTGCQFYPVAYDVDGNVVKATDTNAVIGILQNKPLEGRAAEIWLIGSGLTSEIKINGALTPGMLLMPGTSGAVQATGTGKTIIGILSIAPGTDGIGSIDLVNVAKV